jgi:hypothetical protein
MPFFVFLSLWHWLRIYRPQNPDCWGSGGLHEIFGSQLSRSNVAGQMSRIVVVDSVYRS